MAFRGNLEWLETPDAPADFLAEFSVKGDDRERFRDVFRFRELEELFDAAIPLLFTTLVEEANRDSLEDRETNGDD